jgi:hypothetical protein
MTNWIRCVGVNTYDAVAEIKVVVGTKPAFLVVHPVRLSGIRTSVAGFPNASLYSENLHDQLPEDMRK